MQLEYVGNCVNSFNDDGNCIIPKLPFETVSDFACSLEESTDISEKKVKNSLLCAIPISFILSTRTDF